MQKYKGKPLYCLKIDIKKFYPSIDHSVAKSIVRRKIKDEELLQLLDSIIDSAEGLPIGNYLSQFLANLILAYFIHWVNERLALIIQELLLLAVKPELDSTEYADDICFFSDKKEVLQAAFPLIEEYISKEIRLTIKENYQIFRIAENRYDKNGRALDYVGYKFYRKQKLIRKSIKQNFCRAAAKLNHKQPVPPLKEYKQALAPWLGWAQHCNSKHLLQTIIKKEYYGNL